MPAVDRAAFGGVDSSRSTDKWDAWLNSARQRYAAVHARHLLLRGGRLDGVPVLELSLIHI